MLKSGQIYEKFLLIESPSFSHNPRKQMIFTPMAAPSGTSAFCLHFSLIAVCVEWRTMLVLAFPQSQTITAWRKSESTHRHLPQCQPDIPAHAFQMTSVTGRSCQCSDRACAVPDRRWWFTPPAVTSSTAHVPRGYNIRVPVTAKSLDSCALMHED